MRRQLFATLALAAGLCLASVRTPSDEVYLEGSNTPTKGTVKVDDIDKVEVMTAGGATATFAQSKVKKVVYELTPSAFTSAELARSTGNYERAVESYLEALDERHNPLLRQYILYGLADAYAEMGEAENAKARFKQLLTEVPRTKFLNDATDKYVRLCIGLQQYDEAQKGIDRIKGTDPLRASYLTAQILEARKDHAGAYREYGKVVQNAEGVDRTLYWQGRSGQLRCAHVLKKASDLEALVKDTLSRSDEAAPETMAWLYYLSGLANAERGRENPDRYDDALENFVRVFVLYDTPDTREINAEACYRAAELCNLISTRNRPELRAEAKRLFLHCANAYKDTEWGRKASGQER